MDFLIAALTREELPAAQPDWPALLEAANHHRVTPHLAHATTGYAKPAYADEALREAVRATARQNLSLFAHTTRAVAALANQGIDALALKGPVLAHVLYGDLSMRVCGDVDLLVRNTDFTRAARTLAASGYTCDVPLDEPTLRAHLQHQHDLAFAHEDDTLVELHADIAQPHYSYRTNLDTWFESARTITIQQHSIKTLSPEHSLVFAIVHGTKHVWTRLDLLADVAALAKLPLDWDRARLELARLGAVRAAAVAGFLLRDTLELCTPLLTNDTSALRISHAVRRRLQRGIEPTYWQARLFDIRVRERARDRMRYAGHALQRLQRGLK